MGFSLAFGFLTVSCSRWSVRLLCAQASFRPCALFTGCERWFPLGLVIGPCVPSSRVLLAVHRAGQRVMSFASKLAPLVLFAFHMLYLFVSSGGFFPTPHFAFSSPFAGSSSRLLPDAPPFLLQRRPLPAAAGHLVECLPHVPSRPSQRRQGIPFCMAMSTHLLRYDLGSSSACLALDQFVVLYHLSVTSSPALAPGFVVFGLHSFLGLSCFRSY